VAEAERSPAQATDNSTGRGPCFPAEVLMAEQFDLPESDAYDGLFVLQYHPHIRVFWR
jgi:hypothetical protein